MTDAVSGSTAAPTQPPLVTTIADAQRKTAGVEDKTKLDKDAFLKLLVAQMKYQDPSKPVDSSEFMAQTAQFTQVEKMEAMAADSRASLTLQQGLSASSMIGKTVTWLDAAGSPRSGKVDSTTFGGGAAATEPTLAVGSERIPLSKVVTVAATTA